MSSISSKNFFFFLEPPIICYSINTSRGRQAFSWNIIILGIAKQKVFLHKGLFITLQRKMLINQKCSSIKSERIIKRQFLPMFIHQNSRAYAFQANYRTPQLTSLFKHRYVVE